jgi:hypothetical protein
MSRVYLPSSASSFVMSSISTLSPSFVRSFVSVLSSRPRVSTVACIPWWWNGRRGWSLRINGGNCAIHLASSTWKPRALNIAFRRRRSWPYGKACTFSSLKPRMSSRVRWSICSRRRWNILGLLVRSLKPPQPSFSYPEALLLKYTAFSIVLQRYQISMC